MGQLVGVLMAMAMIGGCATSSGVIAVEANEIGSTETETEPEPEPEAEPSPDSSPPDDTAGERSPGAGSVIEEQRRVLATAPCIDAPDGPLVDLTARVDDWRHVVACEVEHRLQIFAMVEMPQLHVDDEMLDRSSPAYMRLRDGIVGACRQAWETFHRLDAPEMLGPLDADLVSSPASTPGGPSIGLFAPVPRELYDDLGGAFSCYATWLRDVTYSAQAVLTIGADVPAGLRSCFDADGPIDCAREHLREVLADIDVTALVHDGTMTAQLPWVGASDERVNAFYGPADAGCFAVVERIGVEIPAGMTVLAWADPASYPGIDGRYEVSCQLQPADKHASVVGLVFD